MIDKKSHSGRILRQFIASVVVLLVFGIALILTSLHIEAVYSNTSVPESVLSWLRTPSTWVAFFRELGIACMVALLIIVFVELRLRYIYSEERKIDDAELKKNAFLSVFHVLAPQSVVDKTLKITLGPKFFRKSHRSRYTITAITPHTPPYAVQLTAFESYVIQNLTKETQKFEFKVAIEDTSIFRAYQKHHRVTWLKIDGEDIPDTNIENIGGIYRYYKDIDPEDEVLVSFEVIVVRNLDDTEFSYVVYPSDSFTVELQVDKGLIKDWGAFPIHDSKLLCIHDDREKGYGEWKINDTVLPYQGMAIWWRTSPPAQPAAGKPDEPDIPS